MTSTPCPLDLFDLARFRPQRLVLLVLLGLPACGGYADRADFTELGQVQQPVQRNYVSFSQTSTARWANLLYSESATLSGKSTGVVGILHTGESWYNGNCGATFISPQFAVTAAHCVIPPLFGDGVWVAQYDTTNLSTTAADAQTNVSGSWPNWTHSTLSSADGYIVTTYWCTVELACHNDYVRTPNCPITTAQVDIALLRCFDRQNNSTYKDSWVLVHEQDLSNAEIQTWWFHEVYRLATQPGAGEPGPANNWANYGDYASAPLNNYHYQVHDYLPLRSTTWSNGTFYKQIGHNQIRPTVTKTDTPVCHGTSGAGVMERGTSSLFGPVAEFGENHVYGRLCADMANNTPGQDLMGHVRSLYTAQLENMSIVQNDRNN